MRITRSSLISTVLALALPLLVPFTVAATPAAAALPAASDVTFTSAPTGSTDATHAALSFFSESAASYECALDTAAFAACTDAARGLHRVTGLALGSHTLQVRSVSPSGVRGTPASASWTVTKGPVVRWVSKPSGTIPNGTVTAVFTSPEAGYYQCALDAEDFTACGGHGVEGYFHASGLAEGSHTLTVRALGEDSVPGPDIVAEFTIARPLDIEWISKPTGTIANSSVTALFTAPQGGYYQCALDAEEFTYCGGYGDGHFHASGLAEGSHTLKVRALSDVSVPGPVSTADFTIARPLDIEWISKPTGTITSSSVTALFTAPQGGYYQCALDGEEFTYCGGYGDGHFAANGLAEGSHTLEVRALSDVSQPGPVSTATFTIARSLDIEWISKPTGTIANSSVTALFTAPQGGYYQCALDAEDFTDCGGYGDGHHQLDNLSEGSHTLRVRALSDISVPGPESTTTFTVSSPLAVTVHGDPSHAPGGSFAAVFSAPAATAYQCALGTESFSYCAGYVDGYHSLSGLTAGSYVLRVRAMGVNGSVGPATDVPFTATAGDSGESLTVEFNDPTTRTRPTANMAASFVARDAASYTCVVDDGYEFGCSTTYTGSALSVGTHTLTVTAFDGSGEPGQPATLTFVVGAPSAPQLTSGFPATTAMHTIAASFSAPEASSYECRLDDEEYVGCGRSYIRASLLDGAHTLQVRAIGSNGSASTPLSVSFTVDTKRAVALTSTVPAPPDTVRSNTLAVSFVAPGANYYECRLDTDEFQSCSTSHVRPNLPDGPHTLDVRAYSGTGQVGPALSVPFTIDTKRAVSLTSTVPAPPDTVRSNTLAVSFASPGANYYECRLDTEEFQSCSTNYVRPNLSDGEHTLDVRAYNANGQVGPTLSTPFTVDTKQPVIVTSALPAPPEVVRSSAPAIAFYAAQAAWYECRLDTEEFQSCGTTYIRNGLTDGSHTIDVRAYNTNGQVGPTLSIPFTVDTRPVAEIVSAPSPIGLLPAHSVAFSFFTAGASTYSCALDGGAPSACADGTYLAKDLPTGKHVLTVRPTSDGVEGSPLSMPFQIRKDAPDTRITTGPAPRTNQTAQQIAFAGTDPTPTSSDPGPGNLTFLCTLDAGAAAPCTNPRSLTGLTEGQHTFTVQAVNDQGRPDPTPASVTWFVDLTPPALAITGGPSGTVAQTSGTVTFTVDSTAVATTCQLDGGPPAACASTVTYSALSEGPHTVTVRATDDVGNTSTATRTWSVDTTPPAVVITSGPDATTTERSAQLVFTKGDAATVTCSLDGAAPTTCASPMTYDDLSLGTHTFTVTGTDALGNAASASRTWSIGSSVPVPETTIDQAPTGTTGTADTELRFSASVSGATFECKLDGGSFAACSSPWPLTGLTDGVHSFQVRATTEGGTDSTPAAATWTVDTTEPAVTITGGPTAETTSRSAALTFTVSDATPTTVTCSLDGGTATACTGTQTYSDLALGSHTFSVTAVDAAGNSTSAERTWEVVEAPAVPDTTITGGPTGMVGSRTAAFTLVSNPEGADFECQLDSGPWSACTSPLTLTALTDGAHTLHVRAKNEGGTDATPAARTWTVDASAPAVTITTGPAQGSVSPDYTAKFGFTMKDASTWTATCRLDSGPTAPCSSASPVYRDLLPGSSHTFTVVATDAFGHSRTVTRSWTVGRPRVTPSVVARTVGGTADRSHGLGDDFTLVLTVKSTGTAKAESVVGKASIGNGLNVLSLPTGCTRSGSVVSCKSGTLAPGASKSFTIKVEGKLTCTVWGNSTSQTVNGTSGRDVICGGGGGDTINGGGGNDTVWGYGPESIVLSTLDTKPSATYGPGSLAANGTSMRVSIGGTDGADKITTGSGVDVIYGQGGNDSLNGGAGADTMNGGHGNDTLLGAAGADRLLGDIGDDTLSGGNDNDFLYGQDGIDRISGGTGNDDLWGGDGNDSMSGDGAQDLLYGGHGADTMNGGAGHDALMGSYGNDKLNGGTGRDRLWGEDGNDVLGGGPAGGTKTQTPGDHWNRLHGGVGDDACSYGPGTGVNNTDYRDASCERLAPGGAAKKGAGWLNGSKGKLDRSTAL